ncbi:MAG: hypothetical protein ACLFPD_01080 [Desulfosudaceae bacterium]
MTELVTIKVFMTEIEAEIVRGRLLTEGIEAYIFKDDCGGMYPQLRLSQGVAVKVPADQARRAAEVLAEVPLAAAGAEEGAEEEAEETVSPVPATAFFPVAAWFLGTLGIGLMLLGIFEAAFFRIGLPVLLIGLILGTLAPRREE